MKLGTRCLLRLAGFLSVVLSLGLASSTSAETSKGGHAAPTGVIEFVFDVDLSRSVGSPKSEVPPAWLLVADHSGSMTERDGGRTRWEALQESLRDTVKNLPVGSEVRMTVFDSKVDYVRWDASVWNRGSQTLITIEGDKERNHVISCFDKQVRDPDRGLTVLNDALYDACEFAETMLQAGKTVRIVVFSDGLDNPPKNGGKHFSEQEIKSRFGNLFGNTLFKISPFWVGASHAVPSTKILNCDWLIKPPEDQLVLIDVAPASLTANPAGASELALPVSFNFVSPDQAWQKLQETSARLALMLEGVNGPFEQTAEIKLKPGRQRVSMSVDRALLPTGRDATGTLSLKMLPVLPDTTIEPPSPVGVKIVGEREIPLDQVVPASGKTVRVADPVLFSVQTIKTADVVWAFGDGAETAGVRAAHAYAKAGTYAYRVRGTAPGMLPAERHGNIDVVDFGVVLEPFAKPALAGESYQMSCRGIGPVERYEWTIDGEPVEPDGARAEKSGSTLSHVFPRSGEYRIRVKAASKILTPVETERKLVVEPSPVVSIEEPKAGDEFPSATNVLFRAHVEGDVSAVKWTVSTAAGAVSSFESQVVKGEAEGRSRDLKGGHFSVQATATAAGGRSIESARIPFYVEPPNLKVEIRQPIEDSRLETGRQYEFSVFAAGPVTEIRWMGEDVETGAVEELGKTAVGSDGFSRLAKTFAPESTDRLIRISVEGLTGDPQLGVAKAPPVTVSVKTLGALSLESPPNLTTFKFGEEIVFAAKAEGVLKGDGVVWHLKEGADDLEIGRGARLAHRFEQKGRKEAIFSVYAEAPMPSGARIRTTTLDLRGTCPDVKPRIVLPMTNGVEVTRFLIGEPLDVNLALVAGEVDEVKWAFGDGTVGEGRTASHEYAAQGDYTISATSRCRHCRMLEPAEPVRVSVGHRKLNPKIVLPNVDGVERSHFEVDEDLDVELETEWNGAGNVVWDFGDGSCVTNADTRARHRYAKAGVYTIAASATCRNCGAIEVVATPKPIDVACPRLDPKVTCQDQDGRSRAKYSRGETLSYVVESSGKVDYFIFDFGDGTMVTNASPRVTHAYADYGLRRVTVRAVCERCGHVETSRPYPVDTPPGGVRADFALATPKAKYGVGDIVTVQDRSGEKPDIALRIWKATLPFLPRENLAISEVDDGTNHWWIAETEDDDDVQVKCGRLGSHGIGLTVIGRQAGMRDEAKTVQVNVWRWWILWVLGSCGLLVWCLITWLVTGNAPRNWVVKGTVGEALVGTSDDDRAEWRTIRLSDPGVWSRLRKEAVFPLRKFLDSEDGADWEKNEGRFRIWERNSNHAIDLLQTSEVVDDDEALCQREKHRYRNTQARSKPYLHLWVDERPGPGASMWVVLLSFFVIAGLVGALCARFAF